MKRVERMRILTVEDEESTATVVRMLLERKLEASVDIALDCASARKLLSSDSYDLITLDYQLPDGDGLSLLEEIVKMEGAPPVIMVTGHGDERTAVSAFKLGASGYVVKDTRMSTMLIEEARSALARAGLEFERRQLLSIFDSINEIVYVSDPETYEVLYANRAIRKVFGDIVGRKCYEALQGFSEPCQFCTNDRIFGEHDGENYIWEFKNTLDGRWYRCIDRAIRWPNGKAVRYEMAIDITDRKAAEEALRESEEKYRLLYDNAGEAIFSYDPELRLTDINRVGCEAIGYSREEMLGKNILELNIIHPRDLELAATLISRHFAGENLSKTEYTFIRKDGSERLFSVVGAAIRDPDGNLQSITNMCRDITDRKAAEEALQRANIELQGYAHTVSHDLRGPLSAAGTAIDLIKDMRERPLTDDVLALVDEVLDIVASGVDRAITMTEDLLALAEAGQAPATAEPVEISGVVRAVLEERKMLLEERGTRVSLEGDLGVAAMDPTHAYQVFSNLIGNAIKHNDSENLEIHVSRLEETESGVLRYLVRDNGPGIPEGAEEDIFLPFHKGPNSTDTGIGLSTVDKVVRLYGGTIRAYNDCGACFEFTLPLDSSQGP